MSATARHPSHSRHAETVLARAVTRLLACAAREGLNRRVLMEAANLSEADLANPDGRVRASAHIALWEMIAKSVSDPGFGVRAGASLHVRDMGLLGYAMYYSSTVAGALRRLVRYGQLITEEVRFALHERQRSPAIVALVDGALTSRVPLAVDFRLAALLGACREIAGIEIEPIEVDFAYEQPPSILEHHRFFRCPLRFGSPQSQIVLALDDLNLTVPHGDETLAGYLASHADDLVRGWTSGGSIVDRVRAAIWSQLSDGPPTLRRVALVLQLPSRTLQRHLARVRTTLRAEIDHVRRSIAIAMLKDSSAAVSDVAFLLGYDEPSTFYRSFKRWTGMTPLQYRRILAV